MRHLLILTLSLFLVTLALAQETNSSIATGLQALPAELLKDLQTYAQFDGFAFLAFPNRTTYVVGQASSNATGLLGLGASVAEAVEPRELESLRGEKMTRFLACTSHVVGLSSRGKIFTWGSNQFGQLGTGVEDELRVDEPKQIKSLKSERIVAVECGDRHTVVLTKNGELWSWGANEHRQLGANKPDRFKPVPVKVRGLGKEEMKHISAAGNHSLALDDEGDVYGWGDGQPVMRIVVEDTTDDDEEKKKKRIEVKAIQAGKSGKDFLLAKGDRLYAREASEQVANKLELTDDYKSLIDTLKRKDD